MLVKNLRNTDIQKYVKTQKR